MTARTRDCGVRFGLY